MPLTGPSLCHPEIGYVDLSVTQLSTLVPFSPLVHIDGDNADSPLKIPDTKLHGDSKHNPSHVLQHTLPAQHPATPFSPTLTSLNSTSLAAPKANHIQCCK